MNPREQSTRALALVAAAVALGIVVLALGYDGGADNAADPSAVASAAPTATATPDPNATPEPTPSPTPPPTPTPDPDYRSPNSVKVLVANGTDIAGRASAAAQDLISSFGYNALPTNVDRDLNQIPNTIFHVEDYDANAREIADALGFDRSVLTAMPADPPVADLDDAQILVVLGPLPVEDEPTEDG